MAFDEASYVQDFVKKLRGARVLSDDLMARYAVTLPATDAEIAAQIKAVRAYWNKTYLGKSTLAQVARMCRAEDERLRAEHGTAMETRAWWQKRQSERQSAAEESITFLADELRQAYGQLGVVTSSILDRYAAKLGLTGPQAAQSVERAGLTMVSGVTLPETEPIPTFTALLKSMAECAAASVPDLVHPGSGPFRLVERYVCVGQPAKRLDAVAVDAQSAEADKRGISATEDARRSALKILRKALKDGVDLRDIALYHLVMIGRESLGMSASMIAASLQKTGLERTDAAIVALALAEQNTASGVAGADKVQSLLAAGRLNEATQAAQGIPADDRHRADAIRQLEDARKRLDALLADARKALGDHDEVRAAALVKEAALISAEDADEALATIPLAAPADPRAVGAGAEVKLFWRPVPGHDADTVYVVCRTEQRPPAAATDGTVVFRGKGAACTDPQAPVARAVQYGVFALGGNRPSSRPALVAVTLLPPVSQLEADVGSATITLHWSTHPAAHDVRVTRTAPAGRPVPVPVTGSGCRVTGLTEGQTQHFEVTAVYHGIDGADLLADAEQINATPRSEAQPIAKLRIWLVEAGSAIRVRVSWAPVDRSEVRIKRSDSAPPWKFGTWVSQQDMAQFGRDVTGQMVSERPEAALEADIPSGVHHLVPFSIGGTGIVVGRSAVAGVTEPVRHLIVTPFADYATVSWEWPSSARLAELTWELDGNTDCALISVAEYRAAGGARVPLGKGPCTIEVRAVLTVGEARFTAPPVRAVVDKVVDTPVSYTVSGLPAIGPFGGRAKKVVFRAAERCGHVQVRMVAAPGRVMPTGPASGVVILDTALALEPGIPIEHHVSVPRSVKRPYWVRCFVVGGRARLVDPPISSLKET